MNLKAICVKNKDGRQCLCYSDLKLNKAYKVLGFEKENYLRVIDESGEDYLYPKSWFRIVSD